MESWNVPAIQTPSGTRSPVVLHSVDEARVVLIGLQPGQELGEHQVHEAAYLAVVEGSVHVTAGGRSLDGQAGALYAFEPNERRSVATETGAKVLLFLAPWPGLGHYRGEEKARQH